MRSLLPRLPRRSADLVIWVCDLMLAVTAHETNPNPNPDPDRDPNPNRTLALTLALNPRPDPSLARTLSR